MPFSDPADRYSKFISYAEFLKQKTQAEADAWNGAYSDAMDRGDADPMKPAESAAKAVREEWDNRHPVVR